MEKVAPVVLRCRLEVKTPLSITTGEEYTFLEYTIKGGKFYLLDFERFIEKLKKEEKFRKFFEIMREFSVYDIPRLQSFFMENVNESVSLFVGDVDDDMKEYFLRKLRNLESYLEKKDRKRFLAELSKFTIRKIHRNPLTGLPYIPGSSLKGTIRTVILNYLFEEKVLDKEKVLEEIRNFFKKHLGGTWPRAYPKKVLKERKKEVGKLLKSLSNIFSQIDNSLQCKPLKEYKGVFGRNPFSKDLMRFLKVSDFYPVEDIKTSVGIAKRFKKGEIERGEGKLPHYLEYVKKGVFEGEITLYPRYLKSFLTCPLELSGEFLVKALRKEFGKLLEREMEFLERNPLEMFECNAEGKGRLSFVKLGFGAGALSKTLNDDDIRVVGNAVTGIRNVPTELTLLGGKPLGWCVLEVVK